MCYGRRERVRKVVSRGEEGGWAARCMCNLLLNLRDWAGGIPSPLVSEGVWVQPHRPHRPLLSIGIAFGRG
jgi:hypothetical protein